MSDKRADYVIVGAGSAGCAMAYRLSEAGKSVIIIEFGGSDFGPLIQMPGALSVRSQEELGPSHLHLKH